FSLALSPRSSHLRSDVPRRGTALFAAQDASVRRFKERRVGDVSHRFQFFFRRSLSRNRVLSCSNLRGPGVLFSLLLDRSKGWLDLQRLVVAQWSGGLDRRCARRPRRLVQAVLRALAPGAFSSGGAKYPPPGNGLALALRGLSAHAKL